MSSDLIINRRLKRIGGVCYYDDVIIDNKEFDSLTVHYRALVDSLQAPWNNRDDGYDIDGRFNKGGMDEYPWKF